MRVSQHTFYSRLSIGFFFIVLGLLGILPQVDESIFSLPYGFLWIEMLLGILELVCGIFLITSVFVKLKQKLTYNATLIILIVWTLRIFLSKFVFGIKLNNSGIVFLPQFSIWIIVLSCELIVESSLFTLLKTVKERK